jgi:hypothetical protein
MVTVERKAGADRGVESYAPHRRSAPKTLAKVARWATRWFVF